LGRQSIYQSFCCAGFDTWGAKASQELIVTHSIGTPINQSFCCAGFDTWGAKASQDLIVTRGKSFRHEKTKKKRGSYRGGPINTGIASIKFDSD
jgi:hypothetical protein